MNESNLTTRVRSSPSLPKPASALLPGTILAGRYRVVAPLGRGGMGEVYRADDLKLGQGVALKSLPRAFRGDEARRQRLRDEVKLARLVAHPNVCRVWDLVEADGHEFLSMEYVDGEDLASVLRRIGRLPEERAVRMTRELCAGLSAVHDQGILHRDLKPANVMVDGRGRLRIADFGLAALAEDVSGAKTLAGTPAYMSPEQREGRELTVRSDIYALGLVVYEILTGRPAFPQRATHEHGSHSTPSSPSHHVKGLDPAIDRTIQSCLEPDPALRPASAGAVAASLPGADPLAAALAAGETPSPDLVAAVGAKEGLRSSVALAGLLAVVAGIAIVAWAGDRVSPFHRELDKPPEVLTHEAKQILEDLGPSAPPVDSIHTFLLEGEAPAPQRLIFWYLQSPRRLSHGGLRFFTDLDPALPGMANVKLDARGTLVEYVRAPAPDEPAAATATDWESVLRRAGLDPGAARAVAPAAIPPVFGDERRAWELEVAGVPFRAEAAALHGHPVWFRMQERSAPSEEGRDGRSPFIYVLLALLVLALGFARRHLRIGRGDPEGARRIAAFGAISLAAALALSQPRLLEPSLVVFYLGGIAFSGVAWWIAYLALEPLVRRRWPDTLVGWTRLLRGRVRDPLVGRDLLLGVLCGIGITIVSQAGRLAPGTAEALWRAGRGPGVLVGGWFALGDLAYDCFGAVQEGLFVLLVLTLFRQLLGRTWAALVATLALLIVPQHLGSLPSLAYHLLVSGLSYALLVRAGLLTGVVALGVTRFLGLALMTTHLGAWYADDALSGILATLVLAAWGFYASLGGRPLFDDPDHEAA
jgi:serine/threonine-protein kinase